MVTHPDRDHAEGLAPILENFKVSNLWMFRPWAYAASLLAAFPRFQSAEALAKKFRDAYPYIDELEKIAIRKRIPIFEPYQGQKIGAFTVLAPSHTHYFAMLIASDKTPTTSAADSLLGGLVEAAKVVATFIRSGWGAEIFPTAGTSEENEMSVIQFALLNGEKILLTGDAGRLALADPTGPLEVDTWSLLRARPVINQSQSVFLLIFHINLPMHVQVLDYSPDLT